MRHILITAGHILTPEHEISPGAVLIRDDRLAYVGPPEGLSPKEGWERLSFPEGVVLPGLVNLHTHSPMVLLRGYADDLPLHEWLREKIWPLEDRLEAEDVYWGTLLACLEMIASGTTTFADMYFFMESEARAVAEAGLRASLARGLQGLGPNAEKGLSEAEALFQEWNGGAEGRITVRFGPHAPYTCGPEYLSRVRDRAARIGAGLHIHLSETQEEVVASLEHEGVSPIGLVHRLRLDELPILAAHVVHPVEGDAEIMSAWEGGIAHCPRSNLKLGAGVAPVSDLVAAGVRVGVGSDGAASANSLDLWEELRMASLLAKGSNRDSRVLPAGEVLRMATSGGAEVLGLGAETGRLEVGKKADLTVLDLSRPGLFPKHNIRSLLAYSARGGDVRLTMVDGRVLYRDGEFLTIDADRVRSEVTIRLQRLGLAEPS